jgi:cytochrome c oxidase subunit 2
MQPLGKSDSLLVAIATSDVFDPRSPLARATVDLLNTTLIVAAVILALVTGLVVYCIWRFRERPVVTEPRQVTGHKRLEIFWTVLPLLVLVYLFVLTLQSMRASDPPGKSQEPDIVIVGHQFWWEIRYPRSGVITANELHLPVGRRLLVQLKTADVIHSLWIPQLSRKMDMLPDRNNHLWLQADTPGLYHGACSEFCGTQHAWMRILAVAESPEAFEAWQQRQLRDPPPPASAAGQRGAQLMRQLTCVSCHAFDNASTALQAGPDLRHLAERQTLGAGVSANTRQNLALWLKNPQAVKPGNLMPNLQLTDAQVDDMVAYFGLPK